ncbi:MAG TPA: formimidoylglutamate deiminase [Kiloniellales bacterium]|nr:formimidoylglutamate deiminase [Kiloniellales bacterium]
MTETRLFAERALLPDGWARDVPIEIDADGYLFAVTASAAGNDAPRAKGPVVPGMPNLHSHAFQRAMAGLAERAGPGEDSFWTWREVLYRFLARLGPGQIEAIATQLYIEMLQAGYTAVGEFHYLHHDPQGQPYADPAETSHRVIAAAGHAGIGITHLPVLYGFSDFGGAAPLETQRRFLNDPDRFLRIVETLVAEYRDDPQVHVGIAPHSLRAVTAETLAEALAGFDRLEPHGPVHIHVAEQGREVHDCIAWCGARPLEWLLTNVGLGHRWCTVHATQVTEEEARRLAESGAVAGLCPTTEANLGDGVFPAAAYLAAGGAFGIGSDSHVSVSPIEELRWLEYGQRLTQRRRNLLAVGSDGPSIGASLYRRALAGGAQALGRPLGRIAPGCRADLVVLDDTTPALYGKEDDRLLDALVFAGNRNPVRDVMVAGAWLVRDGHHHAQREAFAAYRRALDELAE